MPDSLLFSLVGGLGLLIYGIHLMGVGLQKYAGDRMREILSKVISNRFKGILVGAGVTGIIQSSSATSVMAVGFVSAGLMTLAQAIAVIFGANIGTTITGQLIAFKLTKYALPIIAIGAGMFFFAKADKKRDLGEAILGFGILFLGLNLMTGSTKFLANYPFVQEAFITFSHNPFLGVLVGFAMTLLIQSSSATIGILIALASTGLVDLSAAIPIIMGDNIGTCTTALLASITSNIHAKRTAMSHLMFNVFGTIIGLIMMPLYLIYIPLTSSDLARQVANTHTAFNILNVIIFLPAIPLFVKVLEKLMPAKTHEQRGPVHLERKLLKTPSIAIKSATLEMLRMTGIVKEMIKLAMTDFFEGKITSKDKVLEMEDTVDELQNEISDYLISMTQQELDRKDSTRLPALLHIVNDLERIGDHAENLVELTERKINRDLPFSKHAMKEMRIMYDLVMAMIKDIEQTLRTDSLIAAKRAHRKEDLINELQRKYKNAHIVRLEKGKCNIRSGVVFIDLIKNFEKIGDHLTNIADAKLGSLAPNNVRNP
ncbi:Na/Pi cotransporter family protein [Candidatus Woesearchaeota archaeon]|nr:Na/Pi cotransporter family protein [Candidatus Woesearchaeota archaeon]